VLTNVGLEHTRWLGPTVRDIAREKLAVVREGATLILGADLEPDAREEAAATPAGRVVEAPAEPRTPLLSLAARGAFQRRNFAVAETAPRRSSPPRSRERRSLHRRGGTQRRSRAPRWWRRPRRCSCPAAFRPWARGR
jgi:dihydrofolate synthase/folylpolyglutamate synthase